MSETSLLEELRRHAHVVTDVADVAAVPEPVVKEILTRFGVDTPFGATGTDASMLTAAVAGEPGPFVLKAFGENLVHKSDVGAVHLDLRSTDVVDAVDSMRDRLRDAGIEPAGFLLEEQIDAGAELLVGVVHREPFGHLVILGLGGTLTEIIGRSWSRLAPLSRQDATNLVDELPEALLEGARGGPPINREALTELLLAIAGAEGMATVLGESLAEMECNPVLVSAERAVAADARLILHVPGQPRRPCAEDQVAQNTDFEPVFAPRSIAVAGASTTRATFGNWFLEGYRAAGWTDGLWAIHPEADEVAGVPAVPSLAEIPGGVDYLLSAVPASRTADLIHGAAGRLRFAHVVSGGFREIGADGARLESELVETARRAGVRVLGPNCMGAYSPRGRQTFARDVTGEPGGVSFLSQSGSLAGELVRTGQARGLRYARMATLGNGADVTPGELLHWLVDDPETKLIGLYLEGADDPLLVDALRRATGRKPVVVLVGGLSDQGSIAAASHTGAMTSDRDVWRALSASLGVAVVETVEHFTGALLYLQRHGARPISASGEVALIGPGGGASVLATDAMDRAGLDVTPLPESVIADLRSLGYGSGTSVSNPIEIPVGPAAPFDAHRRIAGPLLERFGFTDVLLHVNVSTYPGFPDGVDVLVENIHDIGAQPLGNARVGLVMRSTESASGGDLERIRDAAAAAEVVAFGDFTEAAAAVAAAKSIVRKMETDG